MTATVFPVATIDMGIAQIEKMERAIRKLLEVVVKSISPRDLQDFMRNAQRTGTRFVVVESPSHRWKITAGYCGSPYNKQARILRIEIFGRDGGEDIWLRSVFAEKVDQVENIPASQVGSVYDSRQQFLDEMVSTFPSLVENLRPYMGAS
jgi:hypothetical protein